MEDARFEMLRNAKLVEEECIMKSVVEHGIIDSAFILKLKESDLRLRVSMYVSKMTPRIEALAMALFYQAHQTDVYGSDVEKMMVVDEEKNAVNTDEELTSTEEEKEGELDSTKNCDEESTCTEKEEKEAEGEMESTKNSDEESTSTEKEEEEESSMNSVKESTSSDDEKIMVTMAPVDEESMSSETKEKEEEEVESSMDSVKESRSTDDEKIVVDEDSTCTEKKEKEEEEEVESSMDSVKESTTNDDEKIVVTMSLAEIMKEQAMSTKDKESEYGIPTTGKVAATSMQGNVTTSSMQGRGFGRGRGFTRGMNAGQRGFGRGYYVRKQQQEKQSLLMSENTSTNDNLFPVVEGLSMYMEKAKIVKTRKQKR